jgi:hypothetical protein
VALSDREFHVLRLRPRQVICHLCLASLAAEVPAEAGSTPSEHRGSYHHGAGVCFVCAQFSAIAVYVPPEEREAKR